MSICQDWTGRRLEMVAEDTKHLLDDMQKMAEAGSQPLGNGWRLR